MSQRRRVPTALLVVLAMILTALIVLRVSADGDPAPQETDPIVIAPSATPTPTPTPRVTPLADDDHDDDDAYDKSYPKPRDIDDRDDDDDLDDD